MKKALESKISVEHIKIHGMPKGGLIVDIQIHERIGCLVDLNRSDRINDAHTTIDAVFDEIGAKVHNLLVEKVEERLHPKKDPITAMWDDILLRTMEMKRDILQAQLEAVMFPAKAVLKWCKRGAYSLKWWCWIDWVATEKAGDLWYKYGTREAFLKSKGL